MIPKENRHKHFGTPGLNKHEENLSIMRYKKVLSHDKGFFTDKIIVDAGCGWGGGTYRIAQEGVKKIYGIDANPQALSVALEKYHTDKTEYINGYIHNMPFKDNTIDNIIFVECFEHVDEEELNMAINEFHRILKPNGRIWITTPELRGTKESFPKGSHFMEYTFNEVVEIMKGHGFTLIGSEKKFDSISNAFLFEKDEN